MLTQVLAGGGLLLALLVTIFFMRKSAEKKGHAEGVGVAREERNVAVNKQNDVVAAENAAIVQEVEKTNEVHDRLKSDPAFAERVRDRFTRPD